MGLRTTVVSVVAITLLASCVSSDSSKDNTPVATQLAITTQPSATATLGTAFVQQPVIQLKDASSANIGTSGVTITASIASGGGTLGGATTATTNSSGVATFTNLVINGAAGSRTLTFSATLNGTSATVTSQAIALATAPTQLAITTQPATSATVGIPLTRQPIVQVKDDAGGNVAISGIAVTASIASGGGTVGGTVTVNTDANGVATFTNLALAGNASTRTLTFSSTLSGALATVVSQPIIVASAIQTIYWSLHDQNLVAPVLQLTSMPLTDASTVVSVPSSTAVPGTLSMTFDPNGRLWILTFPPTGGFATAAVYNVPVTAASTPALQFTFGPTGLMDYPTFDTAGNLWVSEFGGHIYKFTGPFTTGGTLTPSVTILTPTFPNPTAMAFDAAGNLYVSSDASQTTLNIAVYRAPFTSASTPAFFLNGLTNPAGLAFDAQGNLYASSNGRTAQPAIVRYNSTNLVANAVPNIVNPTGLLPRAFGANLAFDVAGNLFVADCSNGLSGQGIRSYPTATNAFSATLAPSTTYNSTATVAARCVWGLAIH